MADVILRLRVDPVTGKRELAIDYTSDSDALPIEHEQAHRDIAAKVVEGGLASAALEVTRESAPPVGRDVEAEAVAAPEAAAEAVPAGPTARR